MPAARLLLLICISAALGCGRSEPARSATPKTLTALLDGVRLERLTASPPTPQARVLKVEAGTAWVQLGLSGADAQPHPSGSGTLSSFRLPLSAVEPILLRSPRATLIFGEHPPVQVGRAWKTPDGADANTWLQGDTLLLTPPPEVLREVPIELVFPVSAAEAFAAGLLDGADPAEVLLTSIGDGERRRRALRLDAGMALEFETTEGTLAFAVDAEARLEVRRGSDGPWQAFDGGALDLSAPCALRAQDDTVHLIEPRLQTEPTSDRPASVLVLLLDTLRADRLGPWRDQPSLTPRLDALLAESTVWTQAWSNAPWTLPSIATLMTGRQAAEHGAHFGSASLAPDVMTLGEHLRASGRRTAAFTEGGYFLPSFGLARGFDHFDGSGGHVLENAQRLFGWLNQAPDAPFFAVLHTYAVHEPYQPKDPAAQQVLAPWTEEQQRLMVMPSLGEELVVPGQAFEFPEGMTAAMAELYDLETRELDRDLGQVLDRLRDAGLLDNCVIALVADHGEEFGEHGLAGHRDTLFPEQLHVPLALHIPGRAPATVEAPVSTVDFAATLLEACGLSPKDGDLGGTSLLGPHSPSPTFAWRHPGPDHAAMRAVRLDGMLLVDGEFRYTRTIPARGLYALEGDPFALENLLLDGGENPALATLERALSEHPEPAQSAGDVELDAALAEQLKALGYR